MEFIDLKAQQQQITSSGITLRKDINQKISAVLDHADLYWDPKLVLLKKDLLQFVGVKYCIGVSSGTDALL